MPRGQYDRSKSKAQRAAEKNADAPKSAVKKARAPYGSKKLAKSAGPSETVQSFTKAFTGGAVENYSLRELSELRGCFSSPISTTVIGKIDVLVLAKLDRMLGELNLKAEAGKTIQVAAPIQASAPITASAPFNPSAPANGQA